MNDDWDAVEEIFHKARELHAEDQAQFLQTACGSNDDVRRKVMALLENDEKTSGILGQSAAAMVSATLAPGTAVGPYEIIGIAGIGGMGQVYRARDSRLRRVVAIKSLPFLVHDSKRIARFEQEATLLASLNHPNIGGIYDVVEMDGDRYLVLEFVEGPTLAERLQSGPIPVGETIEIARQIASALEAAHDKGIIHRDLKPSNIKIGPDSRVKVLDFGLAKMFAETDTGAESKLNPALNPLESDRSLAMGTPSYMSPEQAQGEIVDKRSDIWAFGCILYELLAGHRAFGNEDTPATAESILNRDPDWTLLHGKAPAELIRLLRHCLAKDRARRLQSARELKHFIERIQAKRQRKHWVLKAAVVVILALSASILFGLRYFRKSGNLRVAEAQQITFEPEFEMDQDLSRDGKWMAYTGGPMDHLDIYVRQMPHGAAKNLMLGDPNTLYCRWPRWSPDGKMLAFVSDNRRIMDIGLYERGQSIFTIPAVGGKPRFVTVGDSLGHAWSPDGKRLAYFKNKNLHIISLDNGASNKVADAQDSHSPSWSPDGKWIAFVAGNPQMLFVPSVLGNIAPSSIVILDVKSGTKQSVTDSVTSNTSPVWMPDSRSILFISSRGGSRDVYELKLSDSGQAEGEPVRITAALDALTLGISADGSLLTYSKLLLKSNLVSIPIPKSGTASSSAATHLTTGAQTIEGANISRDGKWILYDSNRSGNQDVYKMLRTGGPEEQLTRNPEDDFQPNWSPDGQRIAFYTFRNGNRDIYVMSPDGTSVEQVTSDPAQERYPDWSPDGRSLVFFSDKSGQQEVYCVSQENGKWGTPVRLTHTESGAMNPRWSPDGKAIVYADFIKGLCLISPDGKNAKVLVPKREDLWPQFAVWSGNGKTVYFRAIDDRRRWSIFSVPSTGGKPRMLVRIDDFTRFEFATDDKDLFFTLPERECDIWLLKLERKLRL